MKMQHWTALLELMSLMVVADDRIREEELRMFVYRMLALHKRLAPDLMFSEGMIRDWFGVHRDDLIDSGRQVRQHRLSETLDKLDDFPNHALLIDALNSVARADGHRHKAELAILRVAGQRWNVSIPRR